MTADTEYKPDGKMWLFVLLVCILFGGSLLYFGRNRGIDLQPIITGTPARQSRVYTVYYNTGVFSPTNLRIHAGDSVKFLNESNDKLHVITDSTNNVPDLAGFDSIGSIPSQGSFTYTFAVAGSFGYHNDLDKAERGMVIVRPQ
jgi:plastocyanin